MSRIKVTVTSNQNTTVSRINNTQEVRVDKVSQTGKDGNSIVWRGQYNENETYNKLDSVKYDGSVYICIAEFPIIGQNPILNEFWDIMIEGGGSGGNDKTYIFNQNVSRDVWNITHNLNKFPSVTIVDSGGTLVEGDVDYTSLNTLTINFSAEFSGKAYLN